MSCSPLRDDKKKELPEAIFWPKSCQGSSFRSHHLVFRLWFLVHENWQLVAKFISHHDRFNPSSCTNKDRHLPWLWILWTAPFVVVFGRAGGRSFRAKTTYNSKKIERAQGHQPVRCSNGVFCPRAFSRSVWCGGWLCFSGVSVVVMWSVMMSCGWLRGEKMSCGWLWGDVRWSNVIDCEMSCHVMWCHVVWCDVIQ